MPCIRPCSFLFLCVFVALLTILSPANLVLQDFKPGESPFIPFPFLLLTLSFPLSFSRFFRYSKGARFWQTYSALSLTLLIQSGSWQMPCIINLLALFLSSHEFNWHGCLSWHTVWPPLSVCLIRCDCASLWEVVSVRGSVHSYFRTTNMAIFWG